MVTFSGQRSRVRLTRLRAEPGGRSAAHAEGNPGKLYQARSRLYQIQTLQVNMRLKALAQIYKMYSFALLYNTIFAKK